MPRKIKGTALNEFKVRVSPEVRTAIEAAAEFHNRTLNAEINERLTRSLSGLAEEALHARRSVTPRRRG